MAEQDTATADVQDTSAQDAATSDARDTSQDTAQDWRTSIAEDELRERVGKFETPGDLARAYAEAESRLGATIQPPGPDATDEEIGAFWRKLGTPESADGYDLEGIEFHAQFGEDRGDLLEVLHAANLTPRQAKIVASEYARRTGEQLTAAEQAVADQRAAAEKSLRDEWGADFDENLRSARDAAIRLGGEGLLEELDKSGLSNSPHLARALLSASQYVSDERRLIGAGSLPPRSAENAEMRIAAIRSDPGYRDRKAPNHAALKQEMDALYQKLEAAKNPR